ncbi:tyrosine-type recombinase/integrase [Nocardioides terrisoli]|uniref:tyrosine-type recombinase/integrase n=1 Tax=Nocardioides terrisoli TaxID=3388267 RepID=UPI00287B9CF3|nr:tyrosine-type recombinase/integrase [Nocardioides marmorisolisilvae]
MYPNPDDPKRRRTKGGFTSKAAAQDWADEHIGKVRAGEWIDPSKGTMTFGVLADQWFNSQHFDRERTRYNHSKMFEGNNALMTTFRNMPIGDITPTRVSTFIKETRQVRAAQTVRHQFYALRMVLDYAVAEDLLLVNPARRVDVKRLPRPADMKEHERKRDRLTNADVDRLVAVLPELYDMYVLLLAATGMRPEEISGLTIGAVDTEDHTVSVHEVVVEIRGRIVREPNTKTPKSRRIIDLDPYAGEALARYVDEHKRRAAKWFNEHPEHDHPGDDLPLFVGTMTGRLNEKSPLERLDYSKPIRHSGFYKRYWRKATRAAGLPDSVRVYDLRHFHASTLLDSGMSIKDVQERLGHANPTMTMDRYWHSRTDDEARRLRIKQVAEAMGRTTPKNVTPLNSKRTG